MNRLKEAAKKMAGNPRLAAAAFLALLAVILATSYFVSDSAYRSSASLLHRAERTRKVFETLTEYEAALKSSGLSGTAVRGGAVALLSSAADSNGAKGAVAQVSASGSDGATMRLEGISSLQAGGIIDMAVVSGANIQFLEIRVGNAQDQRVLSMTITVRGVASR